MSTYDDEPSNTMGPVGYQWQREAERLRALKEEAEAEVERLQSICARVVEWSEVGESREGQWYCRVCGETGDLHDEACPVLAARDALAREGGAS